MFELGDKICRVVMILSTENVNNPDIIEVCIVQE